MKIRKVRVIHPFLFAMYPILAAFAHNVDQATIQQIVRPLLFIVAFSIILLLGVEKMIKDWDRAGLMTSLFLLLTLSYGYSYKLPLTLKILGLEISKHIIIFFFWAVFLLCVNNNHVWFRIRPAVITRYLNLVAAVSMIFPVRLILLSSINTYLDPLSSWQPPSNSNLGYHLRGSQKPDIYYIILDGYARKDVLMDLYEYDNSEFLDALSQKGFYIADHSQSNYSQTMLSLASSLNFEYLDDFSFAANDSINRRPLRSLIEKSKVLFLLKEQGYQFVTFQTGFPDTTLKNADIFMPGAETQSDLERMLVSISAFQSLIDLNLLPDPGFKVHRTIITSEFENLEKVPAFAGPKFVFAHILSPHPPFVFDETGNPTRQNFPFTLADGNYNPLKTDEYKDKYVKQLIFINQLILKTIDAILKNSSEPPIIILQADHGPGAYLDLTSSEASCFQERTSILNAIYLPDGKNDILYKTISPVNTFRYIFNNYFGTDLIYLPDRNYFSTWNNPYGFINVTEQSQQSCSYADKPQVVSHIKLDR